MTEAAPPPEPRTPFGGLRFDMTRLWIRIDLSIRISGLLAALGPQNLQTLLTLATYAAENGGRETPEEAIAADLQVDRSSAIRRLDALCAFRWQGRPLVTRTRAADGRWTYTIEQGGVTPGGHGHLG